ncbi:hypothetical protein [Paraglaciecola polaris]|uniref:hypothetical protein n=1 Tax=Paraglaciecola polaris TaxID=222814 RepID=UPI00058DDBDE|nr:hypothetical protein [Paraglaciecola polaris]
MLESKSFSISRNVFFHACMPPLIIFVLLAVSLWAPTNGEVEFPLTMAIFIAGAGGGIISTYFRLKDVASAKVEANAILQIYISPIIAGLLGWICYAFFITDMISGPLFPEFVNKEHDYEGLRSVFQIQPEHTLDAAKALLWAFIAGFSEKMIPNILDKLSHQAETQVRVKESNTTIEVVTSNEDQK